MKKSVLAIAAAVVLVAVTSIAVWQASGGDSRRQGVLEEDTVVELSWRGDWNEGAEYAPGNVVTAEGVSYVAEAEGEKLAKPEPGCTECGWTELAAGTTQTAASPTLTSPNGSFKIEVTDTGIVLTGPNKTSVLLSADSLTIEVPKDFNVKAGLNASVNATGLLTVESGSNGFIKSPVLTLGPCTTGARPVARINDQVVNSTTISSGSSKVYAC